MPGIAVNLKADAVVQGMPELRTEITGTAGFALVPHLLVRGLLKSLLLAPRQPGLVLFRQLRNSRSRRRVFLLDWRGGNWSFADSRGFVVLGLFLGFLCHMG